MTEPRPHLVPIDVIVRMLAERIETLARELLPLGHREGGEWREARTSHGGLGDSLSVHIGGGGRRGVWMHHAAGVGGDALDLVAYLKFNNDKRAAIPWCKAWLGLGGEARAPSAAPAAEPERLARAAAAEAADQAKRRAAAQARFLSGSAVMGSPVEAYLAGRGLVLRRLGFPTRALRFHPGLWDPTTQRHWPAMLAAVTGADGQFLAVHQTYLETRADGSVRKAPIFDPTGKPSSKRVLGSFRGGCIRLWRGIRVDPATGEVRRAPRLAACKAGVWVDITEGIEDGLTVAIAEPEARVLAAVSLSNLANVVLPACVEGVVLWRQNDAAGSAAEAAFERAAAHFARAGVRVAQAVPPAGIKDANDMARGLTAPGENVA